VVEAGGISASLASFQGAVSHNCVQPDLSDALPGQVSGVKFRSLRRRWQMTIAAVLPKTNDSDRSILG